MAPNIPERATVQTQMTDIPGVIHTRVADEMNGGDHFALHPGASPADTGESLDDATKDHLLFLAEDRFGPWELSVGTEDRPDLPMADINDFLSTALSLSTPFAECMAALNDWVDVRLAKAAFPKGHQNVLVVGKEWKPYPDTPVERLGVQMQLGWSYTLARSEAFSEAWFLAKLSESLMRLEHSVGEDKSWAIFDLGSNISAYKHRVHYPKVKKAVKQVKDAGRGGEAKAAAMSTRTRLIVDEMDKLIARGKPVTEAARICATRKIDPVGKNAEANERLWHRVKKRERERNRGHC